jgi:hypothetical protein
MENLNARASEEAFKIFFPDLDTLSSKESPGITGNN